jgi:hypothetical protein
VSVEFNRVSKLPPENIAFPVGQRSKLRSNNHAAHWKQPRKNLRTHENFSPNNIRGPIDEDASSLSPIPYFLFSTF